MEIADIVIYAFILAFVLGLLYVSNKDIRESLKRTRESERLLEEERSLLIDRVKTQTGKLKESQNARMNELAKVAEFGRLSQGLFHDLMTPLSSIVLHTEKLKSIPQDDLEATQKSLEKAINASRRMAKYIQNIRKTMHAEDGKELAHIKEEIETAIEILSYKARESGVQIIFNNSLPDEAYEISPTKLQQIFSNLIGNAIDSFDGESDAKERIIIITLEKDSTNIKVTVKDTGSGIAAEHLDRIFDPFFTTKTFDQGTGIGLATVKNILEKDLGGSIHVESRKGEGSVFTVIIPEKIEARK